jgi:hypothetical protein
MGVLQNPNELPTRHLVESATQDAAGPKDLLYKMPYDTRCLVLCGPTQARASAGQGVSRRQGGGIGSAASSILLPLERSSHAYNPRIRCIAATREIASM